MERKFLNHIFTPVVISTTDFFPGESKIISSMMEAGLTCFHLRKPKASTSDLADFLATFSYQDRKNIVVHDCPDLGLYFGLRGLHLREATRKALTKREIISYQRIKETRDLTISTSVHSLSDWKQLPEWMDYAFISPVFESLSKPGYGPAQELQQSLPESGNLPALYALGGVTPDRISQLISWGIMAPGYWDRYGKTPKMR